MLEQIKKDINKLKNPEKAKILSRFFKTGKGEYGEGDVFFGLTALQQRQIAKNYFDMDLADIEKLLSSRIHEHRWTALVILVGKYKKANTLNKKKIFDFYLKNTKNINNWDLVDISAHHILGNYLNDKGGSVLYKLAKSNNLWERRMSIIATYYFIRNNEFGDTLKISEILLNDKHDLIHKAVGWMLREVGKRDQETEERFLKKHSERMPRTMLRYAIEKFNGNKRKYYLSK